MNSEQRVEAVRAFVISVRDRKFPYVHRDPGKVDWALYDAAQCTEAADMLALIRELVDRATARVDARRYCPPRRRGRPPTSPSDIAKILLAQSYLAVSNRVAEGLVHLYSNNLGISRTFSYKTIERAYDREPVTEILEEVITLTNIPLQGLEKCFSIDGSGTPTRTRQNSPTTGSVNASATRRTLLTPTRSPSRTTTMSIP